jgi:hypothetical protein
MAHDSKMIESTEQFADDPRGQAELWSAEMAAADKEVEKWHQAGTKIVDRFLDKRTGNQARGNTSRLNLFTSNITTLRSMLYGQMPAIDVKRRYDDYNDDSARVAATILERLLNNDMEREDDQYSDVLRYVLDDRLMPGLGVAKVRYEVDFEEQEVPPMMGPDGQVMAEGYTEERKVWEDVATDYVYWRDVRWSPARTWGEVRWVAFCEYLTKDQVAERFGEDTAKLIPYGDSSKRSKGQQSDAMHFDTWQRAKVWEIWNKDKACVVWWINGYDKVLDKQDDPLGLEGFFPCPKFLIANATTSSFMPRADFTLHQDLYNEIDNLTTRIQMLERAVKAVGVYDKAQPGVQRMLQEGVNNDLIPVDNWAAFAEKGAIQGTVAWMPLQDIAGAMDKLRETRKEKIDLLYQTTGMSDIMRGASTQPNVTATEQGLKARFASVRVTALQDQFADFASQLQRLRAEIIVKHFDDETIVERSNIMVSPDAPYVPQALQLLRDRFAAYRVEIEPDNIARADYAALKNDRVEFITAVGTFIGQALPLAQQAPTAGVALIEMVKWASAGFRGGDQMETVLDQMLQELQKSQQQKQGQQQQPNPEIQKAQMKIQEQQMKQQGKMAEIQAKAKADAQKIQMEAQADAAKAQQDLQVDMQREANQARFNVLEEQQKAQIRAAEKAAQARMNPRRPQ